MRLKPHNIFSLATMISAGFIASVCYALPADKSEALQFAAQRATLDMKRGVTTYSGDVQISQGTMQVKADVVTAHFDPVTQKIERIHAEGSPALYQQQPDIDKGVMVIEAKTVTALFNAATQQVEKIQAEGSPARYQQQPSLDKGVITANANSISYTPIDEQLLLMENASLEQDGASMSASKIVYDIRAEVMQAAGDDNAQERIEIVIPPQPDSQD
jgi:lipopolysaccharide export system protein LptA